MIWEIIKTYNLCNGFWTSYFLSQCLKELQRLSLGVSWQTLVVMWSEAEGAQGKEMPMWGCEVLSARDGTLIKSSGIKQGLISDGRQSLQELVTEWLWGGRRVMIIQGFWLRGLCIYSKNRKEEKELILPEDEEAPIWYLRMRTSIRKWNGRNSKCVD